MENMYIILANEGYEIETARTVIEAVKKYYECFFTSNDKIFDVVCKSEELTLAEIIRYANSRLNVRDEIKEIYTLAHKLF